MDRVVAQSRDMIRKGSRSFTLAAGLFDRPTRDDAYLLYAWCRHCDDTIDGQNLGQPGSEARTAGFDAQRALTHLREATHAAFSGRPMEDVAFSALQQVVHRHRIPEQLAMELLTGFEMDVVGHEYRTLDDTLLYAYRVAGVVGVMMAMVMGARDADSLQRAADLGIAFQLTNISRDVIDDASQGRCYLPAAWLAAAGLDCGAVASAWPSPRDRAALAGVTARLLDEGDRYYASAAAGIEALPGRSAWAVSTALRVYRDIGRVVRQRQGAAWDQRAMTSRGRKAAALVMGGADALRAVLKRRSPPVPRAKDLWPSRDLSAD